jgi:hypothetical protein
MLKRTSEFDYITVARDCKIYVDPRQDSPKTTMATTLPLIPQATAAHAS